MNDYTSRSLNQARLVLIRGNRLRYCRGVKNNLQLELEPADQSIFVLFLYLFMKVPKKLICLFFYKLLFLKYNINKLYKYNN